MAPETAAERRVWTLLTRDFRWTLPAGLGVRIHGNPQSSGEAVRLQVFEVAVATIFRQLRPEYEWYVTPNRPDGGVDFVGRQRFLDDEALGIAAAITIGGQCKKRTTVNNVVEAVAGSLVRMADAINPTFFVVALAARLSRARIEEARGQIERRLQRHCHILERAQLEGLIHDHLPAIRPILSAALDDAELQEVLDYIAVRQGRDRPPAPEIRRPDRVLAGAPFRVTLVTRSTGASAQLWWRSNSGPSSVSITLIGPLGADTPAGVKLSATAPTDDPLQGHASLELVSHAVGVVDLGEILIGAPGTADSSWVDLGTVRVVENLRPRFFARPLAPALTILAREFDRAMAAGVGAVGVVGAGGSGKSRLCDEFALERRRRAAEVVVAKQAKSLDDPHRLLADLLLALAGESVTSADPADGVLEAIARYDDELARAATAAIRATFGGQGAAGDQLLLSCLVVLTTARSRRAPLLVHLQDLHWCTADVLTLVERLLWHLTHIYRSSAVVESGVLFILEGRSHERQSSGVEAWTSETFEAFLVKLDCPLIRCAPFERDDRREFIARLFEDRYSARRRGSDDLLELQRELVERLDAASGGNPFHSLEQIQLLKDRRQLGYNPDTGLLYLIQPPEADFELPGSVYDAIRRRWLDLRARAPDVALLVWGAGLLEDRLPSALFERLRRALAPSIGVADIDATEILWTGSGEAHEVVFRHENYFQAIRRFDVPSADRDRVIAIYDEWFAGKQRLDALDRFRWARVLLAHSEPDSWGARRHLRTALASARRTGDLELARRIAARALDLEWSQDERARLSTPTFLRRCDEEIELVKELLRNDRRYAKWRLDALKARLERRAHTPDLEMRRLSVDVARSNILFNDRKPTEAAELASGVIRRVRRARIAPKAQLKTIEMDALHARGVALALSGEIDEALSACGAALEIARARSELDYHLVSTYANILLARDPETAEAMMRQCRAELRELGSSRDAHHENDLNLGMAVLLRAYRTAVENPARDAALVESGELLMGVFDDTYRFGRYPDAAAASLLLGILSRLDVDDDDDAPSWFAQAVTAASRGGQMETLWRAHINLALALHERGADIAEAVHDHARAAAEILEDSLAPYPQPDRSARFRLVCVPLAHAVRLLRLAGDESAATMFERYPALRGCFYDPAAGILHADRGGWTSHEWLRIGQADYVIY